MAYELLGHLKLTLGHVGEVAAFLPKGLQNSLDNPNVTIADRDSLTGEVRDPEESVNLARQALIQLSAALDAAASCAERAQSALNSQGYDRSPRTRLPLEAVQMLAGVEGGGHP